MNDAWAVVVVAVLRLDNIDCDDDDVAKGMPYSSRHHFPHLRPRYHHHSHRMSVTDDATMDNQAYH